MTVPSLSQRAPINDANAAILAARSWRVAVQPGELADAIYTYFLYSSDGVVDMTRTGTGGGSVNIRGVRRGSAGNSGPSWLWLEFHGYSATGGPVLDGRVVQSGSELNNGLSHDVTFELTDLTTRSQGATWLINGTIADKLDIGNPSNLRTTTSNLSVENSATAERLWTENVTVQRWRTFLFSDGQTYAGRVYHGNSGYVDVSTDSAHDFISNETIPDRGGAFRVVGANASVGVVPLNPEYAALVFDQNLDGTDERFARRTWAQLFAGSAVTETHSAAIANAGAKLNVNVGETVALDALLSHDADGSFLRAEWTLAVKPAGSTAVLDLRKPLTPTFVPDLPGHYLLTVHAIDPDGDAYDAVELRAVTWSLGNDRRVRMRMDRSKPGPLHQVATLDASMSRREDLSDSAPLFVLYSWTLDAPFGSNASLSNPTAPTTTFVPDKPGFYAVRVENGVGSPNYFGESYKVVGIGTGLQFYEQAHMETGGSYFREPIVADFDHDGDVDIAALGWLPSNDFAIRVFLGAGAGQFTELPGFPVDNTVDQLLYGDLTGDGFGDFATLGEDTLFVVYLQRAVASAAVRQIALPGRTSSCGFANNISATITDGNADGTADLLVADRCLLAMQLWTHTSGGNLVVARQQSIPELIGTPIAFGDLNDDNRMDFAVVREPGFPTNPDALLVFTQAANGSFGFRQAVEMMSSFFTIGDFSGDGRDDLVAVRTPILSVFKQDSGGNLEPVIEYSLDSSLESTPRLADLNGDGRLDLMVGTGTEDVLLGLQRENAAPAFFLLPELAPFGSGKDVVAADFNQDGRLDLLRRRGYFGETGFGIRLQMP